MIKWHDLGKNPNVLPEKADMDGKASRIVMAVVDMDDCFDYRCLYYSYALEKWLCAINSSEFEFKVLKWAYIEYTEDAKPSPQHDMTELRDSLIKGVENVDNQIHEFATDVKRNGDSFSEALTCALIGYMASEVKYGILKEFAEHGKTD